MGPTGGSFSAPRSTSSVSVPPLATSAPVGDAGGSAQPEESEGQEAAAPLQNDSLEPAASTATSSAGGAGAGLLLLALAGAAAVLWTTAGNGSDDAATEAAVAD